MSKKEMREEFVGTMLALVSEWSRPLGPEFAESIAEAGGEIPYRLEGLLHSVFATLDGCVGDLPAFTLIPDPHPEDKAFRRAHDEDWWVAKPINDDASLKDIVSARWRARKGRR